MTQLLCPLCKQPVSKSLYDKITGIWIEKQKQEKELREKKLALKKKELELKQNYLLKEKQLRSDLKEKSRKEYERKANMFKNQISKLNDKMNIINKKAEEKIRQVSIQIGKKEQIRYEKQLNLLKKQMNLSAKKELKLKIKDRELKIKEIAQKKIGALEKNKNLALNQVTSLNKRVKDLENQLAKQRTPQVEGLLYEDKLLTALKEQFPDDKFQHTGKGGDIVHTIIYKDKEVGVIVYECKRVLKFTQSHINQTAKAKSTRNADYGILVTNATKKGYNGFGIEKNVIIIHPAGVLSLAKLLRERIIQIANLNLSKEERGKVVQEIMEYMACAEFKNSLETIIQIVKDEYEDLKKEVTEHLNRWGRKRDAYLNIYKETISVKQKTLDCITGDKSKPELPIKKFTLSLPEVKEE